MKEKKISIIFIVILILVFFLNIFSAPKKFSSRENRYLASMPELKFDTFISGDFSKKFEKYVSDQFIFRDKWVSLKSLADLGIGKKDNSRVYFGKDGFLFDINKKIDKKQYKKNIKNINTLASNLKLKNNIKIYLVPTKGSILQEKLPAYAPIINENTLFKNIKKDLSKNLKIFFLQDILNKHKGEYIYYKTDHHWTSLGAFYGYKQIFGDSALKKDDFNIKKVTNDFLGTIYRKSNIYFDNPDYIESFTPKKLKKLEIIINKVKKVNSLYDKSFLAKTDKYSYFLGGNQALITIKTDTLNDKNILILKDSFANSIIPFFIPHYKNIHIIDVRHYNGSIKEYVEKNKIEEIIMIYNIQNFIKELHFVKFKK